MWSSKALVLPSSPNSAQQTRLTSSSGRVKAPQTGAPRPPPPLTPLHAQESQETVSCPWTPSTPRAPSRGDEPAPSGVPSSPAWRSAACGGCWVSLLPKSPASRGPANCPHGHPHVPSPLPLTQPARPSSCSQRLPHTAPEIRSLLWNADCKPFRRHYDMTPSCSSHPVLPGKYLTCSLSSSPNRGCSEKSLKPC